MFVQLPINQSGGVYKPLLEHLLNKKANATVKTNLKKKVHNLNLF